MRLRYILLALPPALSLVFELPSSSGGIYFPRLTQTAPACGTCHNPNPGAATGFPPIRVALLPSERAFSAGRSIRFDLSVTGGQTASPNGGFSMDATAGTFSAGPNTRVVMPGDAITHSNSSTRTWTFGYTASGNPGLVEVHVVANTVNNDFINNDDDMWAFHGVDDTATDVTPVRLFVNAAGVAALGTACVGSFGNVPVLGSATVPAIGTNFAVQLHGAAPLALTGLLLGVTSFPAGLNLTGLGISGCSLFVDPLVTLFGATGAGNAQRGEGTATFGLPIPNDQNLIAGVLHFQAFVFDVSNGRPLPLTMSNGLSATIR